MTPEAPLGEFVDPDEKPILGPPGPDELLESSWVRSSWDLLNGCEVTESGPGDLPAEFQDEATSRRAALDLRERPRNAGEWIRRFALRLAETDINRDPREVIELAKRQWMTKHFLLPEEAADAEQRLDAGY